MLNRRAFATLLSAGAVGGLMAALGGCGSGGDASPGRLTDGEKRAQDAMRDMMAKKTASRKGRSSRH